MKISDFSYVCDQWEAVWIKHINETETGLFCAFPAVEHPGSNVLGNPLYVKVTFLKRLQINFRYSLFEITLNVNM
jgi:hypothetical protein